MSATKTMSPVSGHRHSIVGQERTTAMTVIKAAAVQISPVLYSREGTVDKVVQKIVELRYQDLYGAVTGRCKRKNGRNPPFLADPMPGWADYGRFGSAAGSDPPLENSESEKVDLLKIFIAIRNLNQFQDLLD
jgi:hypothetical protein